MDTVRKGAVFMIAFLASAFVPAAFAGANDAQGLEIQGLLSYTAPAFPIVLKATSIVDGYAVVAFTVDADGRIDDAVTLEASHPAFGEAIMEVLPTWTLTPDSNETIPRREAIQFDFRRSGMVSSVSHLDAAKSAFTSASIAEAQIKTISWERLDKPPQRLVTVNPAIPKTLVAKLVSSGVSTHFIIDDHGQVRIPTVARDTEPQLAAAVLSAVKQWKYSPPSHKGRPVAAEVTRTLSFTQIAK